MAASVSSIFLNYLLNWTFVRVWVGGMAASPSRPRLVVTFNFLALFWLMRRKVHHLLGRRLLVSVSKISAASAVMGIACWSSSRSLSYVFGEVTLARLLDLIISISLGVLIFYGLCRLLRVPEVENARQAIVERLWPGSTAQGDDLQRPYDRIDLDGY